MTHYWPLLSTWSITIQKKFVTTHSWMYTTCVFGILPGVCRVSHSVVLLGLWFVSHDGRGPLGVLSKPSHDSEHGHVFYSTSPESRLLHYFPIHHTDRLQDNLLYWKYKIHGHIQLWIYSQTMWNIYYVIVTQ